MDEAYQIIKECINLISVDKQDYWINKPIDRTVWYSKHYRNGAFHAAFRWWRDGTKIGIATFGSAADRPFDAFVFDLSDPESIKNLSATIREIADRMFSDREPWKKSN